MSVGASSAEAGTGARQAVRRHRPGEEPRAAAGGRSSRISSGGVGAGHGVTQNPATFVTLLIAAVWLAGTGLAVTWWGGGAIGWATLWVALGAAGLALWAALSG